MYREGAEGRKAGQLLNYNFALRFLQTISHHAWGGFAPLCKTLNVRFLVSESGLVILPYWPRRTEMPHLLFRALQNRDPPEFTARSAPSALSVEDLGEPILDSIVSSAAQIERCPRDKLRQPAMMIDLTFMNSFSPTSPCSRP